MHESKRRKNTSTTKTGCPFRVDAAPCEAQPGWKVEVVENRHNHGPVAALSALPAHRIAAMTLQEKAKVKEMQSLCQCAILRIKYFKLCTETTQIVP
jgi:Transcription factor AFT